MELPAADRLSSGSPEFLHQPHEGITPAGVQMHVYFVEYTAKEAAGICHVGGCHTAASRSAVGEKAVLC